MIQKTLSGLQSYPLYLVTWLWEKNSVKFPNKHVHISNFVDCGSLSQEKDYPAKEWDFNNGQAPRETSQYSCER